MEMQGIRPPPGASPTELKAWQDMMDSMVTFIKAATNLMTAVTSRVDVSVKPSRNLPSAQPSRTLHQPLRPILKQDCEPECTICAPKPTLPPCGVCGKTRIPVRPGSAPKVAAKRSSLSAESGEKKEETKEEGEVLEVAAEEAAVDEAEQQPAEEGAAEEEAKIEEGEKIEEEAKEEQPVAEEKATETSESVEKKAEGDCVCAAIKGKKKKSCLCKEEEPPPPPPQEESEEDDCDCQPDDSPPSCNCPPGDEEREQMVQDLKDKLETAQFEIEEMQKDLGKLQRMDASKKVGPHGGPNPAALYKEIMKDSSPPMESGEFEEPMAASTPLCPCPPEPNQMFPSPGDNFGSMAGTYQTSTGFSQGITPPCPCTGGGQSFASTSESGYSDRRPKKVCGPPSLINNLRMQMSSMMASSPMPPMPPIGYQSTPQLMPPGYSSRMRSPYPPGSMSNSCNPCPNNTIPTPQSTYYGTQQQLHSSHFMGQSNMCGPNGCLTRSQSQSQGQSQGMRPTLSFLQNANVVTCPTRYRGNNTAP